MNKEFILKNWNKIILYAENEEKIISCSGRALSSRETEIAKEMGVQKPGSVRILVVDEIVKPEDTVLRDICERFKLIDNPNGLTFGYGFYLKRVHRNSTVPHELVHVSQYEELGIRGFLERYRDEFFENIRNRKSDRKEMPLEKEAREKAESYCKSVGIDAREVCLECSRGK